MGERITNLLTHPATLVALAMATLIGGAAALGVPTDVWDAVTGDDGPGEVLTPDLATSATEDLACLPLDSDDGVVIEGSLGVANGTSGDSDYSESANVDPGDVVKFQIYLRNRELERDIENLRARLVQGGNPFEHMVELQACGTNTRLLQWATTVRSANDATTLVFRPGTVNIRTLIDGEPVDRGGSDAVFAAFGESLGRLPGTPEANDENVLTIAVLADVVAGDMRG